MIGKIKKIYQAFVLALTCFLFIVTIYVLIAGTNAMKKGDMMSIFGYTYSVVPTNSMEPEINVGDSVIGHKVKYSSLEIGQDIIYHLVTDEVDIFVVHRIIRYEEGLGFKTQGINNSYEDEGYITEDNFIARVVWHGNLANIGTIVLEHRGTLFLVLIGILLLISANGVFDIIKTLDEKKKLTLEEEKEKEKIDWENKLREEVLAELENEKNNQNE
jgi:signal peptidase I